MDEDVDEEGEGTVGLKKTKHKLLEHPVYNDASGNYVVIMDGERIVAPSLDELEDELQRRQARRP